MTRKEAAAGGYMREDISVMGDYRFYLCTPGIVTPEMIADNAPDHGLLVLEGSRIKLAQPAPKRTEPNYPAEIRYLRFSIINRKEAFEQPETPEDK